MFRLDIAAASSVLLLAILSGCGDANPVQTTTEKPLYVRVSSVKSETVTPEIRGVGTAAWRRETPLGFTSGGQIARIFVNEGDRVREGQLLASLDTTSVGAELRATEAEVRRATNEAARMEALFRKGWVTKARLEAAQASAQSSSAQLKARRFALATARIVAPSSGVILSRLAEPNQVIAAGIPVVTLGEAAGGYVIRVPLNDRTAAAIARGASASVLFEALGPSPLIGRVVEIGGKARQTTGTFDVEIALPNDARLRSGMIGAVSIQALSATSAPRLLVPAPAIIGPRAGQALVFIIDADRRARLRTVSIGEASDAGVEVLAGLSGGERVALSGFDRLRDGVRVSPVSAKR